MKPILFNTKMVRAVLEGRKTQTRRLVKEIPLYEPYFEVVDGVPMACDENGDWHPAKSFCRVQTGDDLWVREAWNYGFVESSDREYDNDVWFEPSDRNTEGSYLRALSRYWYRADDKKQMAELNGFWRPSIHMPREAARLFLRVTDVRIERLQDISSADIDAEGCKEYAYSVVTGELMPSKPTWFSIIWDDTIKPAERPRYGWAANPWVWVIEFERIKEVEDETASTP